jgi:membrane carboxypeptidase/penicillin-binding protein PbpC
MFRLQGEFIVNDKGKVMTVDGGIDDENRNIQAIAKNGKVSQRWKVVYVEDYVDEPTKGQMNTKFGLDVERDFHIVSQMSSGKYIDLDVSNRGLSLKTANGRKQQVWYFHQQSLTIRTRLNNQSFDLKSSGKTNNMQVWSTNGQWW